MQLNVPRSSKIPQTRLTHEFNTLNQINKWEDISKWGNSMVIYSLSSPWINLIYQFKLKKTFRTHAKQVSFWALLKSGFAICLDDHGTGKELSMMMRLNCKLLEHKLLCWHWKIPSLDNKYAWKQNLYLIIYEQRSLSDFNNRVLPWGYALKLMLSFLRWIFFQACHREKKIRRVGWLTRLPLTKKLPDSCSILPSKP